MPEKSALELLDEELRADTYIMNVDGRSADSIALGFYMHGSRLNAFEFEELIGYAKFFKESNLQCDYMAITYKGITICMKQTCDTETLCKKWDEDYDRTPEPIDLDIQVEFEKSCQMMTSAITRSEGSERLHKTFAMAREREIPLFDILNALESAVKLTGLY